MKLTIRTETEYDRAVRHFRDVWRRERDNAGVTLEVLPFVEPITSPQRGKLFGLIDQLSDESGNAAKFLRNHFESMYGPTLGGKPKPMEDYSKTEASAMIERVFQVASEQGYSIR